MQKYVQNVSQNLGIDIDTITAILATVMDLIARCRNKPSPQELIASDGIMANLTLNRALRANGIGPLTKQGREIKEAMINEAKSVTVEEADDFLSMCSN